jgi:hypothetical protein
MRALEGHQAGDRVELAFHRGATRRAVVVELLPPPPQPDPPPTAAALAESTQAAYAQLLDELTECFAGVSDEAAAERPAPGAWSAKELVAHCIACERDLQSWIAAWVLDIATPDNLEARPNVLPRLARWAQAPVPPRRWRADGQRGARPYAPRADPCGDRSGVAL